MNVRDRRRLTRVWDDNDTISELESKRLAEIQHVLSEFFIDTGGNQRVDVAVLVGLDLKHEADIPKAPHYVAVLYSPEEIALISIMWLDMIREDLSKIGIVIKHIAAPDMKNYLEDNPQLTAKTVLELGLMDRTDDVKKQARMSREARERRRRGY
jgi:hypothetical protein